MAFKTRRQQRYKKLIRSGMEPFEAREFSSVPFSRAPFIKNIVRDRQKLLAGLQRQAVALGWSRTHYERERRLLIAFEYKDKGLIFTRPRRDIIRVKGRPDPWQLFREYRADAIRRGEWYETPRRRKKRYDERGTRIDKGDIKEQKARRRERARESRRRERE